MKGRQLRIIVIIFNSMVLQQYFQLQLKMQQRHLKDFGINPLLGLGLMVALFVVLTYFLFNRTGYAGYIYCLLALSLVLKLSDVKRNELLRSIFSAKDYFKVRLLENALIVLPFLLGLCGYKQYIVAALLLCLVASMALVKIKTFTTYAIPTPFYKKPFEFIAGFRKQLLLIICLYVLSVIAVLYQNFSLGAFSLMAIFLLCLSFYEEVEEDFFVWIHRLTAAAFLLNKIKTALLFSTVLTLPVSLLLAVFYTDKFLFIAGFQLLGYSYLVTAILAKYTSYPYKISLPQAILLGIALLVFPLLPVLAVYFYRQSVKSLNQYLV